jgi:D-glycero-D-manno-heptose 1,7-bisphosphate phosphatase
MQKAVFLDRDGVVNELIYYDEHGMVDSPFIPSQFKLLPGVIEAIKLLHENGYLVVLISNQPGIAKGHMSATNFALIREKMHNELYKDGTSLDGEYYCLHHPEATVAKLKVNCECRKPKPGLILKAAQEMNIDLSQSWFVGDNISDIQAGKAAGCRTILIGTMKCELCRLMNEKGLNSELISLNLKDAVESNILKFKNTAGEFSYCSNCT